MLFKLQPCIVTEKKNPVLCCDVEAGELIKPTNNVTDSVVMLTCISNVSDRESASAKLKFTDPLVCAKHCVRPYLTDS